MAELVYLDTKIYLAGYDISGDLNKVNLSLARDPKDKTCFGMDSRARISGLRDGSFDYAGIWQADSAAPKIDDVVYSKLGSAGEVFTVCPQNGNAGSIAYSMKTIQATYEVGAPVGDLLALMASGQGCDGMFRGTVVATGAKTVTGNGTAYQLGSVGATQKLYAAMHVIGVSGVSPTVTVKIQSDNAENFASPSDVVTFTAATGIGAQLAAPVAGPLTDTWWRAQWTISGTTPSVNIVVVVGIAGA